MNIRNYFPALAVAGLGALAIALAPAAAATPTEPGCTSAGPGSTLCQTNGSAELSAYPPPVSSPQIYPFAAGGGLLFHHGDPH